MLNLWSKAHFRTGAQVRIRTAFALLALLAVTGALAGVNAQKPAKIAPKPANKPVSAERLAKKSPFNLSAGATYAAQANLVFCGLTNFGGVCKDPFDSPTTPGGFWPAGTVNQYIFNSGLQIAGINSAQAGPWANDTVGAYFFDGRGTQEHGDPLTDIFSSLNPADLATWPTEAYVQDTSLFARALLGPNCPQVVTSCPKSISDEDTWVQYWDGDPNKVSARTHPMGIRVEQRSLAFNAPAGAEHTIFLIYKFTNVTNDARFQQLNEAKFGISLPDAGWTINEVYAGFGMDPDVTTHAGDNFSTALLPLNMGMAYHATFSDPELNYSVRSDLYAPPFFRGPGFVGVKYLKSPVGAGGRQVGLTMFTNTTNPSSANSLFPDPLGVKQLFRVMKGVPNPAAGDTPCPVANAQARRICAIVQAPTDTRLMQASGPFALRAGESQTIVVAYTHGAPVRVPEFVPGSGNLAPGLPTRTPGIGGNPILTVEKMAGLVSIPQAALQISGADTTIDEARVVTVPRSLAANAIIAQSIYNLKFLVPRPPESPRFTLVPGNNQVTVIWEPSATEVTGDPFFSVASQQTINGAPNLLFDPAFRRLDVEGYRIYRAEGLRGEFVPIAEFDKTGTSFRDVSCAFDPTFVPEQTGATCTVQDVPLTGTIVQFPAGGRVRNQVTGGVQFVEADSLELHDTGIPFVFVDRTARNGILYRYYVVAFDVNSIKSSRPFSLESPRQPQTATPRASGQAITEAQAAVELRGQTRALNPDAPLPTIDAQGRFSGPMPPTNGVDVGALQLALGNAVRAGQLNLIRIDSVVPLTYNAQYFVTVGAAGDKQTISGGTNCPGEMCTIRSGSSTEELSSAVITIPADTTQLRGLFFNTPIFAGSVPVAIEIGRPPRASGVADFAPSAPQFWTTPPPAGATAGGSRWFSGANETLADPTLGLRWGSLPNITTIWSPQPFADANVSAVFRRFYQATFTVMRAADFQITWGAGGQVTAVRDITHDVAVQFKAKPQASYGFFGDFDGDGVISYLDTRRLDFQDAFGGWRTGAAAALLAQPQVGPTDVNGVTGSEGTGFGLYINGEVYFFIGSPPTSGTWTLRTYNGVVQRGATAYTFTPEAIRMPAVPGLTVALNVQSAAVIETGNDLSKVHTVPDPYYVRSAFDVGPSNKGLRFVNVPNQAIIRVYSLNGTLVRVLEHNDNLGGGEVQWDLRNRNNQFVASGVYFYVVEAPNGETTTGRFTIVQFAR